jgi:hypothetical protein
VFKFLVTLPKSVVFYPNLLLVSRVVIDHLLSIMLRSHSGCALLFVWPGGAALTRITLSALLLAAALAGHSQPKYALVETRELPGNHKDSAILRLASAKTWACSASKPTDAIVLGMFPKFKEQVVENCRLFREALKQPAMS